MPLDRAQRIRMSLGGTTGLPAPFPAIGLVVLDKAGAAPTADTLVYVTNPKCRNQAHIWSVRAGDVQAFEEKLSVEDDETSGEDAPVWHVGLEEVLDALGDGEQKEGIVYVREEAQVLLQLEYGLSAIDSVSVAAHAGITPHDRTSEEAFRAQCNQC